jgi:hypothetical protein
MTLTEPDPGGNHSAPVATAAPNDRAVLNDRCPSCETHGAWEVSRRHRFSPFGSVTLVVLSFWAAVFGWLLNFGFIPAAVLLVVGVGLALFTRKGEMCAACGYVRAHRR